MGALRVGITQPPAVAGVQAVPSRASRVLVPVWSGLATTLALTRQLPSILVALLTPAALVALVMGLWRVSADLDWAGAFPIASGFFSHWQVWIALAIGLKMLSSSLLAWDRRIRKIPEEN